MVTSFAGATWIEIRSRFHHVVSIAGAFLIMTADSAVPVHAVPGAAPKPAMQGGHVHGGYRPTMRRFSSALEAFLRHPTQGFRLRLRGLDSGS
jgi:hypothetical protein